MLAWFLLSVTVLFLYFVGTSESFLEPVQRALFHGVKVLSWVGVLGSWLVLVPLNQHRRSRWISALVLGVGFFAEFVLILVWGSWVYPSEGTTLW